MHLQYLGYPIANDPLYSQKSIWGESLGRGGVDLVPNPNAQSDADTLASRTKTSTIEIPQQGSDAWWRAKKAAKQARKQGQAPPEGTEEMEAMEKVEKMMPKIDLNDREYANIDIGSPIRLSQQAREIIAKLRRARDEQEDWVKCVLVG